MSDKESVDQILKEIVVKAAKDYLDAPIPEDKKHLPKRNTKENIVEKTGINSTTLGRYLDPNAKGSCPGLIEAMEILRVIDKRYALLEFAKKSNCHSAKFIKEYYPKYIETHQIDADVVGVNEEAPLAGEVLKLINEHQDRYDTKIVRFAIMFTVMMFGVNLFYDISNTKKVDQLRESINELIAEIEKESAVKK